MKFNKIILILFFPVMAQLTFSCCCCDDDGPYLSGLGVNQLERVELFLVDNSGAEPILLSNDNNEVSRVNKNAFGIEMQLIYSQFVDCSATSQKKNWFTTAIACSCPTEGPMIENATLKNFKIVTLNDFDSSKLSGEDITPYFNFLFQNNFSAIDQDSIQDVWYDRLMVLLEEPQLDSIFQFEVSFDVNDTLSIKDTTQKVFLF